MQKLQGWARSWLGQPWSQFSVRNVAGNINIHIRVICPCSSPPPNEPSMGSTYHSPLPAIILENSENNFAQGAPVRQSFCYLIIHGCQKWIYRVCPLSGSSFDLAVAQVRRWSCGFSQACSPYTKQGGQAFRADVFAQKFVSNSIATSVHGLVHLSRGSHPNMMYIAGWLWIYSRGNLGSFEKSNARWQRTLFSGKPRHQRVLVRLLELPEFLEKSWDFLLRVLVEAVSLSTWAVASVTACYLVGWAGQSMLFPRGQDGKQFHAWRQGAKTAISSQNIHKPFFWKTIFWVTPGFWPYIESLRWSCWIVVGPFLSHRFSSFWNFFGEPRFRS